MGNLFGGGESKSQTTTSQTYSADPRIQGAAGQALGQAQAAASSPFNLPQAPVAGFSPLQQQAFNQYQALQGYAQPYFDTARNLYTQSAGPVTANDVNQYYNPMADKVFAAMDNAYGADKSKAMAAGVARAGGIGADRLAVTQANLANKHELAVGQTGAGLWQSALAAAQADKARQSGAAQGLTGLGQTGFQTGLAGTSALFGAGQAQQGQTQNELNAPYNLELQRQAYPFQTAQYLAGITGGLAPALGGTTNGVSNTVSTPAQPSMFSQIAGLGLAGAGLAMGFPGLGAAAGGILGGMGGGGGSPGSIPYGGINMPTVGYNAYGYAEGGGVDDDMSDNKIAGVANDGNMAPLPYDELASGGKVPGFFMGGMSGPNQPGTDGYDPSQPIVIPGQSMSDFVKANPPRLPFGSGPSASAPAASPAFPTTQQPAIQPGGGLPSVVPKTPMPQPRPVVHRSIPKINPQGGAAEENPYQMPQDQLPYPDSLERDGGQNMTRSPWMALVEAGATMASTPGGIGTSIGKGIMAGSKALQEQRKELRSEEELNNRARALYQQAKQHLDQYNKMTPYQRASLALRNKELDQEAGGIGGTGGETSTRAFHARALQYYKLLKADVTNMNKPDAEIQAKAYQMARGTAGATSPGGGGDTAATAMPDPGPGSRVKGKWYIGPSGQPQQWLQ